MKFELTKEEEQILEEWENNHKCSLRGKSCCGGETTISFTPTTIGTAVGVKCECGATLELREVCG